MPEPVVHEALEGLAPTRKLVYVLLQGADEEWIDRETLIDRARLDGRTVRKCLVDLRERDLVDRRPMIDDPRRRCYRATPP